MLAELGVDARAQLTDWLTLRSGFMLMWLEGIALAPDQWNDVDLSVPSTGTIDNGGGFLAYGFVVGMQGEW